MSRSAAFYVVKAMERTAMGTTTTASPSRRRPDDLDAPEAIRSRAGTPSLGRRVLAAVSRSIGSARGKTAQQGLGGAVRAD
jgi:hypothetical protein